MKILLLNLPSVPGTTTDRRQRCTVKSPHQWVHPPIALAYLASCLKKWNKAEVKLIDAVIEDLSANEVISRARQFEPQLVISPIGSYSFGWDFEMLVKIKNKTGAAVAGFGETPTALAEKFLNEYPQIDYLIKGEPEIAVSKLAKHLAGKLKIEEVDSLVYHQEGKVVANPVVRIEDLDQVPFPDRSLLDNKKYHCIPFFSGLFTDLMTSKGCPFNCKFCTTNNFWGRKYRKRSVDKILDEVIECIDRFGIKKFFIPDETFTVDKEWLKALMKGFKELGVKWALQTRVDLVDYDTLKQMKKSGCVYIHFGAESGDQRILDYYRKGITVNQVRQAFAWCRKLEIETSATFVLGSPEETHQSAKATIKLAKEIKADYYHFSPLIPLPASEFFDEFKEQGLLKHFDFEKYVKPHIVFKPRHLTEKQINNYIEKAYRSTVMNPIYAWRRFWQVIKRGDLVAFKVLLSGAIWTLKTFIFKK